jgi:Ca-activated chloride channel family protein
MTFLWPQALLLLLLVPVLVGLYVLLLRRKTRSAVRYASVALMREALSGGARFRRHVPPLLFLLALVALIVAVARPRATITLPSEQRTIILAMDVSLSMRANDIQPSRMAAAKEAAKEFVREQPSDVRIGIVTFASNAVVVQKPTEDREELIAAIDRLQMQVHTALGSGVVMALATLFPEEGLEALAEPFGRGTRGEKGKGASLDSPKAAEKKEAKPVPPGSYRSGAIILLTDGRRTIGVDPVEAARMAADHGVKVYTVGFGSADGAATNVDGMSIYMRFDAETLKTIAELTSAEYFHATSATDLRKIYESLNARYVLEKKQTEISALVSALAAVLAIAAEGLSLLWFSRLA